jgi:hypothetical protein
MSDSIQAPLATDETASWLVTEYTTSEVRTVDHLVVTCKAIEYAGHGDAMDLAARVCTGWEKNIPAGSVTSPMGKLFTATIDNYWKPLGKDASLADILTTVDQLAHDLFGTGKQRWTMVRHLCQAKKIVQRAIDGDIDLSPVEFIHDAVSGMVAESDQGLRYGTNDTVKAMGGILRAGYDEYLTDADKAEVAATVETRAQRDAVKAARKNRHPDAALLNAASDMIRALSGGTEVNDPQAWVQAVRKLAPYVNGAIAQWDAEATATVQEETTVE